MSGKVVRGGDEKLNPESHFFFLFSPKPVNQLVLVLKPAKVPKLFPWFKLQKKNLFLSDTCLVVFVECFRCKPRNGW